jgi:nitrite reductase (NADH) small subunit
MSAFHSEVEFHAVGPVGTIPEGEGRQFLVRSRVIAVFLKNGVYFAINDACPHMGASLAEGYLDDHAVICPWHAWKFNICDGLWLDNPKSKICTDTYPTRVVDGMIEVGVPLPNGQQPAASTAS